MSREIHSKYAAHVSRNSLQVRRTSYNFTSGKSFVRHISQTIRRIEKHFFLLEVHLMNIYILPKSQFRNFDSFQRER